MSLSHQQAALNPPRKVPDAVLVPLLAGAVEWGAARARQVRYCPYMLLASTLRQNRFHMVLDASAGRSNLVPHLTVGKNTRRRARGC